jgi:ABC-type uncharacterized transport system substrate-binding protein
MRRDKSMPRASMACAPGGDVPLLLQRADGTKPLPSYRAGGSRWPECSFNRKALQYIVELDGALAAIRQGGSKTLIVQPSPVTYRHREPIVASAMMNGLGTIFAFPVAAREGLLIGYGPDYHHMYSRAPFYVDRVLKGTMPADLPVEQSARVEFPINLQTAKTLGIEVPLPLLIRADDLLE